MTIKTQAILVLIVGLWFYADATQRENKKLVSQAASYREDMAKVTASLEVADQALANYITLSERQANQTKQALTKANALNKKYQEILDHDPDAKNWATQPLPDSIGSLLQ